MIMYVDVAKKRHELVEDIAVYVDNPEAFILFGTLEEAVEFAKNCVALNLVDNYIIVGS